MNEHRNINVVLDVFVNLIITLLLCSIAYADFPELQNSIQSSKSFLFTGAILLTLLPLAYNLYFKRKNIAINFPDILILIILIFITANRYWPDRLYGFSLRYIELLGLYILYYVVRNTKNRIYHLFLLGVTVGAMTQAIYGSFQFYNTVFLGGQVPLSFKGSFINSGPFAGYLASAFPVALCLYIYRDRVSLAKSHRGVPFFINSIRLIEVILPATAVISMILIVGLTKSRAACLSILCSSFFVIFHQIKNAPIIKMVLGSRLKKTAVVGAIIVTVILAVFSLYNVRKGSADGRLLIWKVTSTMIKDRPFTGLGFDRFRSAYMTYQAQAFRHDPNMKNGQLADDVYYAFCDPLEFAVENGCFASIVMLLTLILLFKTRLDNDPVILMSKAGLLSVLIFSLFSYPSHILPITINAVVYAAILAGRYRVFSINIHSLKSIFLTAIGAVLIISALAAMCYASIYLNTSYKAFKNWGSGKQLYVNQDYSESVPYLKKAYPQLCTEGEFLLQYARAVAMTGDYSGALRLLDESSKYYNNSTTQITYGHCYKGLKRYKQAENAYKEAWYMSPVKFQPKFFLMKLYAESGQKKKAVECAEELLNQRVKVESVMLEKILAEARKTLENYNNGVK